MTGAYSRNKGVLCWIGLHQWKPVVRYLGPDYRTWFLGIIWDAGHRCTRCGRRK